MKKVALISVGLVIILMFPVSMGQGAFPSTSEKFNFTLLDGSTANLGDYQDKPIVLDWSASWCSICKENQKTISSIYSNFEAYAYFITISYGGSGDDLDNVKSIQQRGPYPWIFALDTENYAAIADTQNADVWILDTNLTIVYSWDYALVGKSDFSNKLSAVIGGITSEVTSEITVTSGDTTFTTTTVSTTVIDNPVSKVDEEVQTFGLFENPLFVGFLFLTGIGIVYVVFTRRG